MQMGRQFPLNQKDFFFFKLHFCIFHIVKKKNVYFKNISLTLMFKFSFSIMILYVFKLIINKSVFIIWDTLKIVNKIPLQQNILSNRNGWTVF